MRISNIVLIVYIIGVIVSVILFIHSLLETEGKATIKDLAIVLLFSLFSWIAVVATLFIDYGDIVVFRKKEQ